MWYIWIDVGAHVEYDAAVANRCLGVHDHSDSDGGGALLCEFLFILFEMVSVKHLKCFLYLLSFQLKSNQFFYANVTMKTSIFL